ncbi:protein kinase family protein [Streptomyces sp. NBC_00513]|uniref:protein kinase family protein n=1 Tax=unclassified Streptomyces TaxID=2593676 RepID=UPI00225556FB|nr:MULTISPECIES: protein kinase family protein [unclassified Streptomyces]MCX5074465.1 protein kinase family protein [Streptomyces sp. NBC_00424]MCX5154006.1 protein kinase family protein [Streptomyces sp. NBC_00291]WUD42351.1 protein kinase family protein [Streptomyces sp. NBC_00513]
MAERSTAAVDVADNGGDEPSAAEAAKATADGVDTQNGRAADGSMPETDGERINPAPAPVAAPELHSGHKLARRYRLEECVTRLDGFSSWRAMDEKLRRAVGVHLLPADHPRARAVLAAARSSALLGDPRFVQVLDAVEENDLVYVVHEWLPDATELTSILALGPLEAHEAYQLVSQVSQAMTAAHREGLAHLRLTPSAILRTSSGQYRIRGLAVNAALRGITSDTPQQADTEAVGALLYAALTQRWPYENDAYGLAGLPKGVGLIAPDQVRAGVHRGLGELAMRALANDGATASRQEPAFTTPEELAKAVAAMPRIRPPEPAFTAPPEYQQTTYQQGSYGRPTPMGLPTVQSHSVTPPPPPLQSRTGRALKWSVAALLIVALGLGSWQLADTLLDRINRGGNSGGETNTQTDSTDDTPKKPEPGKPLSISDARVIAPGGDAVKPEDAGKTVDGDPDSAWITPRYVGSANFGNLDNRKNGSGIIVDLGSVRNVTGVDLDLYAAGQRIQVRAAAPDASSPDSFSDFTQPVTKLEKAGKKLQSTLEKPVRARYLLVHVTELPPESSGDYRGGINEIKILGTTS